MAIKKRNLAKLREAQAIPDDGKLHIVAKPKVPLPDRSKVKDIYGENPTPSEKRRLGLVAIDCGDTPDQKLTVTDRVDLLRTPYDDANPQEARYRNRVRNRGTAITAMCVVCQGGRKAVTECSDTACPLWAFRFGSDPFYGKRKK